ncbi:MAG: restriction endonuclease subunit S [Bacteroidota bacterium]
MGKEFVQYDLPKNWAWATIGDLGIVVSGGTPSTRVKRYWDGDIPWITPADLTGWGGKYIAKGRRYISKEGLEESSARLLPKGSILFSSRAPIGYVAIAESDIATSQGFKSLLLTNSIVPDYIFYYLKSSKQLAESFASGTTFLELSGAKFSQIPIPIPPIAEQKLIVERLEELFSELDNGISHLELTQKHLDIYHQLILKNAFNGKMTGEWRKENKPQPAKELLRLVNEEIQTGYQEEILNWKSKVKEWENEGKDDRRPTRPSKPITPSKPNDIHESKKWSLPSSWEWTQLGLVSFVTKLAGFEYTKFVNYDNEGDLAVIKAENAGPLGFKETNYSRIKSETVSHLNRTQLSGGELIVVFVGSGTGNVAVVPKNESFFLGPNVGMARPYGNINSKFLQYFYQSPEGKDIIMVTAKAVAQPSLSMATIRQAPLALPSIEEQSEIVDLIESQLSIIEKLEEAIRSNLKKSSSLRQSILKQAFKGNLVPEAGNQESAIDLIERIKKEKESFLKDEKLKKSLDKSNFKKKRKMAKELKSILDLLGERKKPISSKRLWEDSIYKDDIDAFYAALKDHLDAGEVVELPRQGKESYLKLAEVK